MKCITCGAESAEAAFFCDHHLETRDHTDRFARELHQEPSGDFTHPHQAERILSEDRRPATLRRVVKWMLHNGYSKWPEIALRGETLQSLKAVATVASRDTILITIWHVPLTVENAMRDIGARHDKAGLRHIFQVKWNDWPRAVGSIEQLFPILIKDDKLRTWMPRQIVKSSMPEIMVNVQDGKFTCILALTRGQIVGGQWVQTKTGTSKFVKLFDGATMVGKQEMGNFGRRCIAPATIKNLEILVAVCMQPLDVKIEAMVMAQELIKRQEALSRTFGQRMSTDRYEPDGRLHQYVYDEKPHPLIMFQSIKTPAPLLEAWRDELNFMEPYSQQKITAQASFLARYVAWWIDMRVGKTPTGLMLMSRYQKMDEVDHCVVVAPAINVYDPWFTELEKQGKFRVCVLDSGSAEDLERIKSEAYDVYVISYSSLAARLPMMQWFWDMSKIAWFFDETSLIKNPQSQRFKAAADATEHAYAVYDLNGTPLAQGPQDVWSQQYVVDRGVTFGVSFGEFAAKWLERNGPGKYRISREVATLFELYLAGSSIRYIRSEADQFSGKDKNFRYVEVPPTEEMKRDTKEILLGYTRDNNDNEADIKTCILTVYGHLRECCAGYRKWEVVPDSGIYKRARHSMNPKVTWVRTFLKGNPGQPMVIFSENNELEDMIMEMLEEENISYSYMRPKESKTPLSGLKRKAEIDAFQEGRTRVILMKSTQAKGVTLNRLPAVRAGLGSYPVMVYTQPTWSLIDWEQSQDRCVGTDPKTKKSIGTMIYCLIVRGSIEGKIVAALRGKKKVAEALLADAARNGYSNPFEEMDLTDKGDFEGDEFFDALDLEARYHLGLAPQKKLSQRMIEKADLKYKAAKYGTTQKAQVGRPQSSHALYLLQKFDLPFATIEEAKEAKNVENTAPASV